jgi:hypothetical protein
MIDHFKIIEFLLVLDVPWNFQKYLEVPPKTHLLLQHSVQLNFSTTKLNLHGELFQENNAEALQQGIIK